MTHTYAPTRYGDKHLTSVTQSRLQSTPPRGKTEDMFMPDCLRFLFLSRAFQTKHTRSWPSSQQFLHKPFCLSSHFSAVSTWKALPLSNHHLKSDGFRVSTVGDNESTVVVTKLRYRALRARRGKVQGVYKYTFLALAKNTFRTHTHTHTHIQICIDVVINKTWIYNGFSVNIIYCDSVFSRRRNPRSTTVSLLGS
jgi:hypothetical protein